jgi:hypothetical protein
MNTLRGEALVTIDGDEHELVIDMDALARVSEVLSGRSMGDALEALVRSEPRAIRALLLSPANKDLREAVKTLPHIFAIGEAAQNAFTALMGGDEGNGEGAAEKKKA